VHQCSKLELSGLSAVIRKIWRSDPPRSPFLELVQWSAGVQTATPEHEFCLCEPKALLVMLAVFKRSLGLLDAFAFIRILCAFGRENCSEMHASGIDSALLDIVIDPALELFQ
jgi:hypothetical protein